MPHALGLRVRRASPARRCAVSSACTSRWTATTARTAGAARTGASSARRLRRRAAGQRARKALPATAAFASTPAGQPLRRVGGDELLFADGARAASPSCCIGRAGDAPRFGLGRSTRPRPSRSASSPSPAVALDSPRCARRRGTRRPRGLAEIAALVRARTRWCTTCRRAGSSSSRAAAGARATSARGRWRLLLALGRPAPVRDLLLRVLQRAERRRRLAAVVHVLRARAQHPRRRFARRHRVLAAAGARAVPARQRATRALLDEPRVPFHDDDKRHASGSTSNARSR